MADFSQYTGPSAEWIALEATLPPIPEMDLATMKAVINKGREEASAKAMVDEGLQPKVSLRDHSIPSRDGSTIEARSYRPSSVPASQKLPIYIHLHGGGFLFGTLSSEDAACSRIVTTLTSTDFPVVVVNVNYRHTPEYKYPVALNDVEDAFHWIHDHVDDIGGDGSRLVVGGISAGGWLTASLTLAQHLGKNEALAQRPRIQGQILIIPALVLPQYYDRMRARLRDPQVSSYASCANAPVLPQSRMELFCQLLLPEGGKSGEDDRQINPGYATAEEVKGLPPAVFGIAGNDPLRDEGLLYAKLLTENGVPTDVNVFHGLPHGFRRYGDKLSESKRWDAINAHGIKWALEGPKATGIFDVKTA